MAGSERWPGAMLAQGARLRPAPECRAGRPPDAAAQLGRPTRPLQAVGTFEPITAYAHIFVKKRWLVSSSSALQAVRPAPDLESLEESELFMELIRDVANELDINVLCHKILKNVNLLTHADRGSLFLARGVNDRYLVAKLFDVRQDTSLEEALKLANSEEIRIPFGVGIAGTVAENKIMVNIKDAYNVSR